MNQNLSKELPLSITNLYSELHQLVVSSEAMRSIGDLSGTFVKKNINDKIYWYLQYSEAGTTKQAYLGPETKELKNFFKDYQQDQRKKLEDIQLRKQIISTLQATEINQVTKSHLKIIKLLSESGLFQLGTVLVGTNAFIAYSALLGVRWLFESQTHDIDLAQDQQVSIAISKDIGTKIDLTNVLERAKMGFHPVPAFHPKHPSTSFKIIGKETHLDLLTPLKGKPKDHPVPLTTLNSAATPLRYLDILLEDTIQIVIPYDKGILINVPSPVNFLLHKYIISYERPVTETIKRKKDLKQVQALFEISKDNHFDEIKNKAKRIASISSKLKKRMESFQKEFFKGN